MSGIKYRRDIDGLRSLAVLPVVLNHAGYAFMPGGFVGVDIFFVISGFLITKILVSDINGGSYSLASFYERRARRILPALFIVLLSCFTIGWLVLLPKEFADLSKSTLSVIFFASNLYFLWSAGDYFADSATLNPLLHTWSLAVEEQFYLFFPLLLSFLHERLRNYAIVALCVGSFLFSVAITTSHPTANFYLLPTRIWELGIGAMLAVQVVRPSNWRMANHAASLIGILVILLSVCLINETMPFPGLTALLPCLGAGLIIWSGQNDATIGGRFLGNKVLVFFGLISYSLYLWHWPILVAARLITDAVQLEPIVRGSCVCLSIALAFFCWRYVERPFRNAKTGFWAPRRRIFSGAALSALLIVSLAGVVYGMDGFSSRLPKKAEAMLKNATSRSPLEVRCMSREIGDPPCNLGEANGAPRFVIWGDSHAGALLAGFDQVLKENRLSAVAFTKSACLPVPGLWRVDQGPDHRCDANNADALRQIEQNYRSATVVLISRWALVTQEGRSDGEFGPAAVLARTGEAPRTGQAGVSLVREALDDVIARLTNKGVRVVILGGIPEQGRDVAKTFARYSLLGKQPKQLTRGWVSEQAYQFRNQKITQVFEELESKYGIHVIDTAAMMCTDFCRVKIADDLLYRDDDHLSEAGALWLARQLFQSEEMKPPS